MGSAEWLENPPFPRGCIILFYFYLFVDVLLFIRKINKIRNITTVRQNWIWTDFSPFENSNWLRSCCYFLLTLSNGCNLDLCFRNQLLIKPMSFSHYPHACNNCYDSITFFVKHICSFKWQEVKLAICKDVWIRKLLYSQAHNEQRENIIMLCILSPSKQRKERQRRWPG